MNSTYENKLIEIILEKARNMATIETPSKIKINNDTIIEVSIFETADGSEHNNGYNYDFR